MALSDHIQNPPVGLTKPAAGQQSVPAQLEALRDYAQRHGWTIVQEVSDVGSGAKSRPKREALMAQARARTIDVGLSCSGFAIPGNNCDIPQMIASALFGLRSPIYPWVVKPYISSSKSEVFA
jgi:hypothetical protein